MKFLQKLPKVLLLSGCIFLCFSSYLYAQSAFTSAESNRAINVNTESYKLNALAQEQDEMVANTSDDENAPYKDLYKIELLVFAYVNTGEENSEIWRNPAKPDFSQYFMPIEPLQTADELTTHDLPTAHIEENEAVNTVNNKENKRKFLDIEKEENSDFKEILRKMAINGHYRTLQHLAWEQKVLAKEAMDIMYIQGGTRMPLYTDSFDKNIANLSDDTIAIGTPDPENLPTSAELEGIIHIYRARYLHIIPELYFTEYAINDAGICPVTDAQLLAENSDDLNLYTLGLHNTGSYTSYTPLTNFVIEQKRRLKNGELHYLDHPRFGFLIKFSRKHPPENDAATGEQEEKAP